MDKYHRVFNYFDSNGDGKICPAELQQCFASIGAGEMTEEEAVVLMEYSDGDGLLCLEDFVKIVEGAGEEERESDLKEAFNMYVEAVGGCNITPNSLKRMMSRLGEKRSAEECKKMIDCFDLNNDGVLCFEEFKIMMSA